MKRLSMEKKLKILYSLPHPADRLGNQGAGHVVRATALLDALESLGHEVIRLEASTSSEAKLSVNLYRKLIRNIIPRFIA
jgi:spore coat polysaccharide biosynthesis predicted glycosyltransferase SpsG